MLTSLQRSTRTDYLHHSLFDLLQESSCHDPGSFELNSNTAGPVLLERSSTIC
jgi:hypothetical protein